MSRTTGFNSRAHAWFGLALLLVVASAGAGELYQWKDAKGVTHYSDSPPPNQPYKNRTIRDSGNASAAAKPAESAQCTTARMNLEHLKGTAPAGFDADRDGKPDALFNADQRRAQVRLAEAAVTMHCTPPPAAPN